MLAVIWCLDRKNIADKQVKWTDIGEKTQELVPNIEKVINEPFGCQSLTRVAPRVINPL